MTCEPQPSAGSCAAASIDYAAKTYQIDAVVLGQDEGTNRALPTGLYGTSVVLDDDGIRANEARPVGQPFSVEDSGGSSGLPVVALEEASDPLQLSFSVTNPATAHEMIGGGFASINFDFEHEYRLGAIPILRIYGTNAGNNGIIYLPLPVDVSVNGLPNADPVVEGSFTRAGMSATVPIGPRTPIDPGESWGDTISFEILAGTDPNMSVLKWSARIEGILL